MTWLEHHSLSEGYASEAELASRRGEFVRARELYQKAAQFEEQALQELGIDKLRTYSITAISAVSLYFKAAQWDEARILAYRCLASDKLLQFAWRQLEDLLDTIKIEQSGIEFDDSHLLVSLKGGEILPGSGPMDLIIEKYQRMRALLYRTTEYMKQLPHRRRGEPNKLIQNSYRPWLFQATPGSYQFSVAFQETRQLEMFDGDDVSPEQIVDRLFGILQACAESPREGLLVSVPDYDYRNTFLKLTRDLAPTGKGFSQLNIQTASAPYTIAFFPATRYAINDVIRTSRPSAPNAKDVEIRGTLRALHLDSDWIEVTASDNQSLRVDQAGEEVDDRIGPMVNHPVVVYATQIGGKFHFVDIEMDDADGDPLSQNPDIPVSDRPIRTENGFQNTLL